MKNQEFNIVMMAYYISHSRGFYDHLTRECNRGKATLSVANKTDYGVRIVKNSVLFNGVHCELVRVTTALNDNVVALEVDHPKYNLIYLVTDTPLPNKPISKEQLGHLIDDSIRSEKL
jgi:hypothetical protein